MSTPSKDSSRGTSKIGFGQIKSGKQTAAGSFAIRFSASALDDDDDLDILNDDEETKERYNRLQFEMTEPEPEPEESHEELSRVHSVSAPVSEVSTPVAEDARIPTFQPVSKSPSHSEVVAKEEMVGTPVMERSILSGFRERFEGRLPDQLTAFIGRIEEMSNENSEEKRDRRLQKGESLDEKKLKKSESFEYVKKFLEKRDSFMANKRGHSRNTSLDSNVSAGDCGETNNVTSDKSDKSPKSNNSSFELLSPEDFQNNEDANGNKNESNSSSTSDIQLTEKGKSRSMFKNLMSGKDKKSRANSPTKDVTMTLSGLMSVHDVDEDVVEATEDVFFDPNDDSTQTNNVSASSEENLPTNGQVGETEQDIPKKKSNTVFSNRNKLAAVLCIVLAYFIPLSPFMWGLLTGAAMMWTISWIYNILFKSSKPLEPLIIPDLKTMPKLQVPEMKESKNKDNRFTGWMNELYQYNPEEYSINHTHSVYVQLEGTKLRLQRPKVNVPRRAMWDDTMPATTFLHQRHFEIDGSKVYLLPKGLVKKRLWSKKYPICIALAKTGCQSEKNLTLQASFDAESSATFSPCHIPKSYSSDNLPRHKCKAKILYLFARTSREKEDWFRRLDAAASGNPLPTSLSQLLKQWETLRKNGATGKDLSVKNYGQQLSDATSSPSSKTVVASTSLESSSQASVSSSTETQVPMLIRYINYMGNIMPARDEKKPKKGAKNLVIESPSQFDIFSLCDDSVFWVNAVVGRLFWDFLSDDRWARFMSDKLQKKMAKIHVPYFIDEFKVTEIEFGQRLPTIRQVSPPYLDERGLWVDMDVVYQGDLQISVETKINLMKLKKSPVATPMIATGEPQPVRRRSLSVRRSAVFNSDEEDSAESSTDEDCDESENLEEPANVQPGNSRGRKLMKLVDRITQSRYFQQATEYKYIKRAMEEVSNTRLMLNVEVKSCMGVVAINIPPPPSDRLWYGFRGNPKLVLIAKPKVGQRAVSFAYITEWLEKKMTLEFQRMFVMPNMDDIPIPLMCDQLDSTPPPSPDPDPVLEKSTSSQEV